MIKNISGLFVLLLFAASVPSVAFAEEPVDESEEIAGNEYELVGLTLAHNMAYDIPSNRVGMSYEEEPKQGVVVVDVTPNSVADEAGFKPGDIVYRYDGDEIDSVDDLIEDMITTPIEGASVRVLRKEGGKEIYPELNFSVGNRYTSRFNMLLYSYSRTPYFMDYSAAFYLWRYKRARYSQFAGFFPVGFEYRRVSTRSIYRILWFFDFHESGPLPTEEVIDV